MCCAIAMFMPDVQIEDVRLRADAATPGRIHELLCACGVRLSLLLGIVLREYGSWGECEGMKSRVTEVSRRPTPQTSSVVTSRFIAHFETSHLAF
jgi:hypothetical protein